jgi:hypothetical protein
LTDRHKQTRGVLDPGCRRSRTLPSALDDGAVVTQESEKKPVRIPAGSTKFGVRFMPLYQMNKELNMKL